MNKEDFEKFIKEFTELNIDINFDESDEVISKYLTKEIDCFIQEKPILANNYLLIPRLKKEKIDSQKSSNYAPIVFELVNLNRIIGHGDHAYIYKSDGTIKLNKEKNQIILKRKAEDKERIIKIEPYFPTTKRPNNQWVRVLKGVDIEQIEKPNKDTFFINDNEKKIWFWTARENKPIELILNNDKETCFFEKLKKMYPKSLSKKPEVPFQLNIDQFNLIRTSTDYDQKKQDLDIMNEYNIHIKTENKLHTKIPTFFNHCKEDTKIAFSVMRLVRASTLYEIIRNDRCMLQLLSNAPDIKTLIEKDENQFILINTPPDAELWYFDRLNKTFKKQSFKEGSELEELVKMFTPPNQKDIFATDKELSLIQESLITPPTIISLAITDKIDILIAVIKEIERFHQHNVIHNDSHHKNVMVSKQHGEYHASLIDYGLSEIFDEKTDKKIIQKAQWQDHSKLFKTQLPAFFRHTKKSEEIIQLISEINKKTKIPEDIDNTLEQIKSKSF